MVSLLLQTIRPWRRLSEGVDGLDWLRVERPGNERAPQDQYTRYLEATCCQHRPLQAGLSAVRQLETEHEDFTREECEFSIQ